MTRFVVLEHEGRRDEGAVFLRDRFYVVAFLLPFLWLASHRLYGFAALALFVQAGLWTLGRAEGFGFSAAALMILFGVAVALEGPRLVAWRLRAKGWRETGFVNADGPDEAELIYYGSLARDPAPDRQAPAVAAAQSAPAPTRVTLPVFGWRSGRSLLDPKGRR